MLICICTYICIYTNTHTHTKTFRERWCELLRQLSHGIFMPDLVSVSAVVYGRNGLWGPTQLFGP